MATKENKGGVLKNNEIEEDLKAKGKAPDNKESYVGSQDTGDKTVRHLGNDVQKADGRPMEKEDGES